MTKARFVRTSKDNGVVRDPKGNALSCVLLHVVEKDERGPRLLRYCHDDETFSTVPHEDGTPQSFLMVWSANQGLAETSLERLQLEANLNADRMFGCEIEARDHELDQLRAAHAKLVASDEEKTIELRLLHQERDPKRFETAVRERIEAATAELQAQRKQAIAELTEARREIEELKRSKKKLREALDRLKDAT